jgi:glycosyltransferase involved in cell wall biosynthesis
VLSAGRTGSDITATTAVSVVVPSYNHATYVRRALDSVAAQTHRSLELLVIDDASVDDTAQEVDRWILENPNIDCHLVRREFNGGICAALNDGLARASGDIFVVLASDDWLAPGHVAECLRVFDEQPRTVAAFSDLWLVTEDGEVYAESYFRHLGAWPPPQGMIYADLVRRNHVPAPGTAVLTSAAKAVGGYDEAFSFEDYPMWLKLAKVGEFNWTAERTVYYRSTPGGLSRTNAFDRALELIAVLDKELCRTDKGHTQLVVRARAERGKTLYAYAHNRPQRAVARRYLRSGIMESCSASMVLYFLAAHARIPYSWVSAVHNVARRGS